MPLSFFSPDGRISVAAVHSPLRSMKSNMASKRPRSLMNASKGRPSTMSCSTRCRSLSQMRKLSPPTAAVTGLGTEPIIPSICDTRAAECPAKSTKNDKNVLSGLGLLQLLPPLLQGCGDPPPLLQILLEGAVSGAVLPHHSQFFPLDIKSASNGRARSGTGSTLGSSRGATGAQEAFHQRSRQHDLGLHEFGFQRAALPLQSTDLPAPLIAGVRHVSVLLWNQLIQTTPSAISPRILFAEPSNNLASNRLRNSRSFRFFGRLPALEPPALADVNGLVRL